MFSLSPPPVAAEAVLAAKSYLRIETPADDALLTELVGAAIRHVEGFTNLLLLRRPGIDRLPVSPAWQRLGATPVQAITTVTGLPDEGERFALPANAYAIDIDGDGDGWIRVILPGAARRIDVALDAGLAADWSALPEPLRLGVLRLTGHLYTCRDRAEDAGPPAAVAALIRPWRRMQLS